MIRIYKLLFAFIVLSIIPLKGQLTAELEIRPRAEYSHSNKTLIPEDSDPAVFASQRSRLNVGFEKDFYKVYLSLQDVRTWGEENNTITNNGANTSIFEAYGLVDLGDKHQVKFGRQSLSYDDQRIIGGLDWAQQGRAFDALLFKGNYKSGLQWDLGIAYNQVDQSSANGSIYTGNDFKTLQYLWLHKDFDKFKASLLAMNVGKQRDNVDDNGTYDKQTVGMHLKYLPKNFTFLGNVYYQTGKESDGKSVSAYLASLDVDYKIPESKLSVGAGVEYLSGTNYDETNKNNSFDPTFGTNHKFNGFMDYFYVGNHGKSVGLTDIYGKIGYKSGKWFVNSAVHSFSTAENLSVNSEKNLGIEADVTSGYVVNKDFKVVAGYTQMFASEGMEQLKGITNPVKFNNWAYVMVVIKPTIFSSKE
ncbi:MAG: alginate export family protein [Flavobacteriales bacterium]|nr:alginate export family protein [Flavobacteriales bacterium]